MSDLNRIRFLAGLSPLMEAEKPKQIGFDVHLDGKCIDTVYYDASMSVEDVKKSLVDHDGYDSGIKVVKSKMSVKEAFDNQPIAEDHGKGFYVETFGGGRYTSVAWYPTKPEAEEHLKKLKDSGRWSGKPPRITPDTEVKESIESINEDAMTQEQKDKREEIVKAMKADADKLKAKYGDEWESVMYATATKQAMKESETVAESGNNNFFQPVEDDKNELNVRMGVDLEKSRRVAVPKEVMKSIDTRIAEIEKAIEEYDDKGYNDKSIKLNAIEVLEKFKEHFRAGTVESHKEAQIYMGTLMGPILDLLPASVVRFVAASHIPLAKN